MEENVRVGQRVAGLRKLRGLTQHQLAAVTHFSTSLIKQVEQGVTPPSAAFVAAVANALGVTPAHLYGTEQPLVEEPDYTRLAGLREAIDAWDDPQPVGDLLTLDAIDLRIDAIYRDVERAAARTTASSYANAATELAVLLHHLYVLADQPGVVGERARGVLHDAYRLTATIAGKFRTADLAAVASERHIQLAPLTGDPCAWRSAHGIDPQSSYGQAITPPDFDCSSVHWAISMDSPPYLRNWPCAVPSLPPVPEISRGPTIMLTKHGHTGRCDPAIEELTPAR